MDEPLAMDTAPGDDLHATYLDRSKKELEKKVDELTKALATDKEKLRAQSLKSHGPGRHGRAKLAKREIDIMSRAYQDLTAKQPFLPFPDSVLPALLALRTTELAIENSKKYLSWQKPSVQVAKERLETEQASLSDQKALTKALENRIQSLRSGIESRTEMTPGQVAKERVAELKQKIKELDTDTSKLMKGLKRFINEPLATMLAAEQIGGPVAGDIMEIDPDDLDAGFSARGKRKKSEGDAGSDKRQRRIDAMLGGDQAQKERENGESDKKTTAGEEMQSLTEELMNSLMDSGGSSSDAYVQINEESAAVRFLLRSKVAEFHPRDSKRLRLVDFGREIDN